MPVGEESLWQLNDLDRFRSWGGSFEVGILASLELAFLPLSGTLSATPFLVQLFLSTDPLPLALFH
jgi:hypothetical protein